MEIMLMELCTSNAFVIGSIVALLCIFFIIDVLHHIFSRRDESVKEKVLRLDAELRDRLADEELHEAVILDDLYSDKPKRKEKRHGSLD